MTSTQSRPKRRAATKSPVPAKKRAARSAAEAPIKARRGGQPEIAAATAVAAIEALVEEAAPVSAVVPVNAPATPAEPYDPGALINKYLHLVRQIAGGFQRKLPRNVLRDDLVAAGMSGLWDAVRKHGHEATGNFDWYVRVRIRGAILDELRAQDWLPRRARAAAAEAAQASGSKLSGAPVVLRFDEVSESEQARCLTAGESSNTERTVEANFVKARLALALEQLPERERRIVAMHYFRGIKFKDLGEMLGVSEPRISQLHSRAMVRLKVILADAA
jgi:RNA polymerase sigma factor for flagellar operon FliA